MKIKPIKFILLVFGLYSTVFFSQVHAAKAPSFNSETQFFSYIAEEFGPECSTSDLSTSCRLMNSAELEMVNFLNEVITDLEEINPKSSILNLAAEILNIVNLERPDLFNQRSLANFANTNNESVNNKADTFETSSSIEATADNLSSTDVKKTSSLKGSNNIRETLNSLEQEFDFDCRVNSFYVYCPSLDIDEEKFNEIIQKIEQLKTASTGKQDLNALRSISRALKRSQARTKLKSKLSKRKSETKSKDLNTSEEWIQYLSEIPSPQEFFNRINQDFGFKCKAQGKIDCEDPKQHIDITSNIEAELNEALYAEEYAKVMNLRYSIHYKLKALIKAKKAMLKVLMRAKYSS